MLDKYECDGQLTITDLLKSKIEIRQVKDFTDFLNSQGKSQYKQIGDIVSSTYEQNKSNDIEDILGRITNNVSVFVLQQSLNYSEYLREQSKL